MAEAVLERQHAVARYLKGESATAISQSLGHSREWLYKWVKRQQRAHGWADARPRRPQQSPHRLAPTSGDGHHRDTPESGAAAAVFRRAGDCVGMHELGLAPPSLRTIGRVLERHSLIARRSGPLRRQRCRVSGVVRGAARRCASNRFVGPCYLHGAVRFYSLHSVDVATRRCGVQRLRQSEQPADGRCAVGDLVAAGHSRPSAGRQRDRLLWQPCASARVGAVDPPVLVDAGRTMVHSAGRAVAQWHRREVQRPMAAVWPTPADTAHRWPPSIARMFASRIGTTPTIDTASLAAHAKRRLWPPAASRCDSPTSRRAPQHPLPKPAHGRYHLIRFVRHRQPHRPLWRAAPRAPRGGLHLRPCDDRRGTEQLTVAWTDA